MLLVSEHDLNEGLPVVQGFSQHLLVTPPSQWRHRLPHESQLMCVNVCACVREKDREWVSECVFVAASFRIFITLHRHIAEKRSRREEREGKTLLQRQAMLLDGGWARGCIKGYWYRVSHCWHRRRERAEQNLFRLFFPLAEALGLHAPRHHTRLDKRLSLLSTQVHHVQLPSKKEFSASDIIEVQTHTAGGGETHTFCHKTHTG